MKLMHLTILYRGPLVSCNYGCNYCPFAKRQQTPRELAEDRAALERFVEWIEHQCCYQVSILFTPWGEALIQGWYQKALGQLSQLPQVSKVAIQTNLSCRLDWLKQANTQTLGLWCTYHPEWSDEVQFLEKCAELYQRGIRFSVGVVGFPRFREAIARLRQQLPPSVYLWINAVKSELSQLSAGDRAFFESIDPFYTLNTHHYPSLGKACRAGQSVISVDGNGTMRRCHFIPEPIGNLYAPDFHLALQERPCSNLTCHCHIGYVHLDDLNLVQIFGAGLLERIPLGYGSGAGE